MDEPIRHGMLVATASGPDDGPPVVVLHGWGSNASIMAGIAAALAGRWRVYNVDLPGHGAAPLPKRPLDLSDHAGEVRSFIREVVKAPAAIVGHSNGGRIGLYLATEPDAPGIVTRLALVSPSGIRRRPSLKVRFKRLVATTLRAPFMIMPRPIREFGLDWLRHSLVWRLLSSSDYRALEGVMRDTFVRVVNAHVEDRLGLIDLPLTVFWGDGDTDIVRDQVDRLVAGVRGARLVVLPGAGHYGFLDRPDLVLPALRTFLSEDAV